MNEMGNQFSTSNDENSDKDEKFVMITRENRETFNDEIFSQLQTTIVLSKNAMVNEYRFCSQCNVTYFEQNTSFTCSYASLQMITSALLTYSKVYRETLFNGVAFVPDVVSIQALIENAWERGFDADGSAHFQGKLQNKAARIGCSDIAALLRANRVPTRIFDFDYGLDSWRTVKAFCREHFFQISKLPILPLILGYFEHTIVVIGCEHTTDDDIFLFAFDPASGVRRTREKSKSEPHMFRINETRFSSIKQFQLLKFGPYEGQEDLLINDMTEESASSKTLRAIRPARVV
jgi:hypothetical protein